MYSTDISFPDIIAPFFTCFSAAIKKIKQYSMIHSSIYSGMWTYTHPLPILPVPYQSLSIVPASSPLHSLYIIWYINNQNIFLFLSSCLHHQLCHQTLTKIFIYPSIHSNLSKHSRFFPFVTNHYWSFPFSTQCSSFDILILNTAFPSSPASSRVLHNQPCHQTPINILIHYSINSSMSIHSQFFPFINNPYRLFSFYFNVHPSIP